MAGAVDAAGETVGGLKSEVQHPPATMHGGRLLLRKSAGQVHLRPERATSTLSHYDAAGHLMGQSVTNTINSASNWDIAYDDPNQYDAEGNVKGYRQVTTERTSSGQIVWREAATQRFGDSAVEAGEQYFLDGTALDASKTV